MTPDDHQGVVDRLQGVIDDTRHTLDRFEATGMATEMPADYARLHALLGQALKDQRAHAFAMLDATAAEEPPP